VAWVQGCACPESRTLAPNILFFVRSDAAFAPPSWLRSAAYAGSWGTGNPSRRIGLQPSPAWYNDGMAEAFPEPSSSPGTTARGRRPLAVWLAGRLSLDAALSMAERLAWEVSEPGGRPPTLLVHELEPVITIGRLGSRADVQLTDDELRERRLTLRFIGRGGGAVPHGPGQVCVSLFATLEDLGLSRHDVGGYLARLEAGLEAALRQVRCGAIRHPGVPGVFGRTGLLAAVGVTVRRGVVRHGAFVNASPGFEPLDAVQAVPRSPFAAGLPTRTMGSVQADLQRKVRPQDVRTALVQQVADAFGFARTSIQSGFPVPAVAARTMEAVSRVG
jgi:lipoyl(octanoyl) transferase